MKLLIHLNDEIVILEKYVLKSLFRFASWLIENGTGLSFGEQMGPHNMMELLGLASTKVTS